MSIRDATEAGFTLDLGDDQVLSCTLAEGAFTCDSIASELPVDGLNAVVSQVLSASGDFSDDLTMDAKLGIDVDCEGEDCQAVADAQGISLPCSNAAQGRFFSQS